MIYLNDLLNATEGRLYDGAIANQFSSFAFDSRQLEPGQIFVAVKTSTGDGHNFIPEAIRRGATGILCENSENLPDHSHLTTVIVPDTRQALIDYAGHIIRKYRPKVVAVTGSNGKTTTKEAIAQILGEHFKIFKSYGSYNGRYGLPIALGYLKAEHEIAILELGSDSFGEISEMAKVVQPQVGVVTTVNRTHLARLGTVENVAVEKSHLVEALPFTGCAVLNADDPRVAKMIERTPGRALTFGFSPEADVRASEVTVHRFGTSFAVHYLDQTYQGQTPLLGRHQIYPVLAAITTGLVFDIPPEDSLTALEGMSRVPGRMNPLSGRNGALVIDDTINTSPESMMAAISTLDALSAAHKIAILGDIPELGDNEDAAHRQVGEHVATRVTRLVTKGEVAQKIAEAAQSHGLDKQAVRVTFTSDDAVAAVEDLLSPGAVVLVNGGTSSRLENVVQKLLETPHRDSQQLVRQEPGWKEVRYPQPARPTWVEIELEAVASNVGLLADLAAPAQMMAVLKADAYGHGMLKVCRTALNNGAHWIAVATLGEAIKLREAGIDAPILVLSYLPAWQAHDAIRHNIRATVFSDEVAHAFSRAATELNEVAYVHCKVDTGLGRLGLLPSEVKPFLQRIKELPGLRVEGVFTHFATADDDLSYAREQLQQFQAVLADLTEAGLRPPLAHAANTAGLLNIPAARFDLVRPGIGLYGLNPSPQTPLPAGFKSALTFKSTVGQVKRLPPGSPIGYGATYRTTKTETIAVIPVGYADGFRRGGQTWGEVLVKGQRAPLVGRVSMDQAAINISHIPNVQQGDEVVLIGKQGEAEITADEVAQKLGTINYEVISQLLARIPRVV